MRHSAVKILLILLMPLLSTVCSEKTRQPGFYLCREVSEQGCIPPLLSEEIVFNFRNPDTTGTLKEYADSLYFAGDTLAFSYRPENRNDLTEYSYAVEYTTPPVQTDTEDEPAENDTRRRSFKAGPLQVHHSSLTGFINIGAMIENLFTEHLEKKYHSPAPFTVRLNLFRDSHIIGYREITVFIRHDTL